MQAQLAIAQAVAKTPVPRPLCYAATVPRLKRSRGIGSWKVSSGGFCRREGAERREPPLVSISRARGISSIRSTAWTARPIPSLTGIGKARSRASRPTMRHFCIESVTGCWPAPRAKREDRTCTRLCRSWRFTPAPTERRRRGRRSSRTWAAKDPGSALVDGGQEIDRAVSVGVARLQHVPTSWEDSSGHEETGGDMNGSRNLLAENPFRPEIARRHRVRIFAPNRFDFRRLQSHLIPLLDLTPRFPAPNPLASECNDRYIPLWPRTRRGQGRDDSPTCGGKEVDDAPTRGADRCWRRPRAAARGRDAPLRHQGLRRDLGARHRARCRGHGALPLPPLRQQGGALPRHHARGPVADRGGPAGGARRRRVGRRAHPAAGPGLSSPCGGNSPTSRWAVLRIVWGPRQTAPRFDFRVLCAREDPALRAAGRGGDGERRVPALRAAPRGAGAGGRDRDRLPPLLVRFGRQRVGRGRSRGCWR